MGAGITILPATTPPKPSGRLGDLMLKPGGSFPAATATVRASIRRSGDCYSATSSKHLERSPGSPSLEAFVAGLGGHSRIQEAQR